MARGRITIRLLEEADRDAETGWDAGDLVYVPGTGLTAYNGTSWAPVGAGVDASTLVGWTQDGETGVVDTSAQGLVVGDVTSGDSQDDAALLTSGGLIVNESGDQVVGLGAVGSDIYVIVGRGATGPNGPVDAFSIKITPDAITLSDDAGQPGTSLTVSEITGFTTIVPMSPPEVPATPTAQDVVDALVTLGLVTQAAP